MTLQTKLLLTNSVIVVILVTILGLTFYQYNATVVEDNATANIELISQKMSLQLDDLIRQMDLALLYTASDQNFLTSLNMLSTVDRSRPGNMQYITQSRITISAVLRNYASSSNYYRLNIFNDHGDFLSSSLYATLDTDAREIMENLAWLQYVSDSMGKHVIVSPYYDPWDTREPEYVFSLVRALQGGEGTMGFIEVQNRYERLEELFSLEGLSDTDVVARMPDGELFYSSNASLTDFDPKNPSEEVNLTEDYNVATNISDYTGIEISILQSRSALLEPLRFTASLIFIVGLLLASITIVVIFIISRTMIRPLRNLKDAMEKTSVENLTDDVEITNSNNEITAIVTVFTQMRERLTKAITRENQATRLQMQAYFDSLQAQVDPHFMYNILTVLSQKGLESNNLEIGEICQDISAMLRYSTSTSERYTTIEKEVKHATTYLQLQKKRFEHKLEYSIDIDPGILSQNLPKIVLQQLIENSINHGYSQSVEVMHIEARGYSEGGWWYIEVLDNGQGFSPEVKNELDKKIEMLKQERMLPDDGFSIGGLGILNVCARLSLYYNGVFDFVIDKKENMTCVRVGGMLQDENTAG